VDLSCPTCPVITGEDAPQAKFLRLQPSPVVYILSSGHKVTKVRVMPKYRDKVKIQEHRSDLK
jgi:hypothetical protein